MYVLNKKHATPPGEKTHYYDKADWVKCWCGLYHSNRVIPGTYWEKYKYKKKEVRYNCGVILRKEHKFFMVQSYNNYYGFPKGSVDSTHEQFEKCASREFFEETGHNLDIHEHKFTKMLIKNKKTQMTYVFFVIKVDENFNITTHPRDDFEITSYGWIDKTHLNRVKLSKITNKALHRLKMK